jgi:hypothetical protein
MPNDPIRPLHDVWLRPRRVFRELAARPIGHLDLLLGAAQGAVEMLVFCRAQNLGASFGLAPIFVAAALTGPIAGVVGLYVMGAIYSRLASGSGRPNVRVPLMHVLAYGAVPMAVSLGIWLLTALIVGDSMFLSAPRAEDEGFIAILLSAQFISYLLLAFWSVVIQIMGFSEVLKVTVGKAIVIWVLGRLVLFLAMMFIAVIARLLVPGS